jgi:hypothetical protein
MDALAHEDTRILGAMRREIPWHKRSKPNKAGAIPRCRDPAPAIDGTTANCGTHRGDREVGGHAASNEDGVSEAVRSWITWANGVADALDPLAAGVARLLQKHQQVAEEGGRPEERFRYSYGHTDG